MPECRNCGAPPAWGCSIIMRTPHKRLLIDLCEECYKKLMDGEAPSYKLYDYLWERDQDLYFSALKMLN